MPVVQDRSLIQSLPEAETEWWYYHGHLKTSAGYIGFHFVLFRRNTENITIGRFIKGKYFCENAWFAHFSITDTASNTFHYSQRRSLGGVCNDTRRLWIQDWSIREDDGIHYLKAQSKDYGIALLLKPAKLISEHHKQRVHEKTLGHKTDYQSVTRLYAEGFVTINNKSLEAEGTAWMDRECGPFQFDRHLQGWDWFAIQTNDMQELMIYRMRDAKGKTNPSSRVMIHDRNGTMGTSSIDDWELTPIRHWTSPRTNITYPVEWHISSKSMDADFTVNACIDDAELDARGSSCMIYWEGPATTNGKLLGKQVRAHTYTELVGYNDQCHTGTFDYSNHNLPLLGWLYSSACYHLRKNGVTRRMSE